MNIDITSLKTRNNNVVEFSNSLVFPKEKLDETELKDLKNVEVKGSIKRNLTDAFDITLNIQGIMVLPCALTLKPVDYPFTINVEGNLEELLQEIDNHNTLGNIVDILPIIWENILMEIPMRVISDDANIDEAHGEGWQVINDLEADIINPALEKLKDLL